MRTDRVVYDGRVQLPYGVTTEPTLELKTFSAPLPRQMPCLRCTRMFEPATTRSIYCGRPDCEPVEYVPFLDVPPDPELVRP